MNSFLDDLENVEDLNDLESRLYAQIHHEAPTNDILTTQHSLESDVPFVAPLQQRVVTNTSVINNVTDSKLSKRYWCNSQNTQQVGQHKKWKDNNPKTDMEIGNNEITKLKEKTFKPFKAYDPIISNITTQQTENQSVVPTNELSIHQKKSTFNTTNKKNLIKLKKQRQRAKNMQNQQNQNEQITENRNNKLKQPVQENEVNEQFKKTIKYNKKTGVGLAKDEPLVRNYLKMQRTLKIEAKKNKAKAIRQKNIKKPIEKVQTISFDLITDDEADDDDVIVIPVPPPPVVTINDTSDEETAGKQEKEMSTNNNATTSFAKPKNLKISNKIVPNITESNSSRCASPCSVISTDDFIIQADRSRLLNDRMIVNDDDLICIEDNGETYIENENESNSCVDQNRNLNQVNISNRKIQLKSNDYRVTQDVYCESESDITESNCSKSSTYIQRIQSKTSNIIIEESSQTDSDSNDNNATQKIKRLRKRSRASSSNKETEQSNDSTDSDHDESTITNDGNKSITTLPFITRGEAVEKCKIKPLKKQRSSQSSRIDVNSSDNEFINMLQTFSQVKPNNSKIISLDQYSDDSTKSEDDLTARIIAEEILNKRDKKSKQLNEENSNVDTVEDIEKTYQSSYDNDIVLPIQDMELLQKQFDIIDNYEYNSKDVTLDNVINVDPNRTDNISNEKEEDFNNIYNVIYTNSNNIGWNEEMIRFYNCSWGGQNFNVNQIRKKMDRKAKWTIDRVDRFPKHKRFSNTRCNNCAEMGHMQSKCPQPKKPLICSMCGEIGHREPRCPNTICLKCGQKTRVFIKSCNACSSQNRLICPICKIRGHGVDLCPDKWRRYHSTIINNAQPNSNVCYSSKKFCCICAGRGHLSENCKVAYRFSEYPASLTEIKSHRKSYEDQKKVTTLMENINSYNLLYEPDDNINFSFSTNSNITDKQYYGRFLNAVGLSHIAKSVESSNKRKFPLQSVNEIEKPKEKIRKTIKRNNQMSQNTNKNIKSQSKNVANIQLINNKLSVEISEDTPMNDSQALNAIATENEELNENSVQLPEHNFKSPNILVEKSLVSPEQTNLNKTEHHTQNSTLKEPLNLDSDSNYSFSEHFDINIATSTPAKISRPMEELPDFIPLNSTNNDNDTITNNNKLQISTDINLNSDDDTAEFENTFKLTDIPCVAKIYLKKIFSDYLLSPDGNQFLVNNSNKFDVKASIDWTSVGNILVLEGLPANQDKFHTQLLLAFRSLPDKLNRNDLEKYQQVPRKRIKMIRFLSENLRILHKNIFVSADVNLLHKQLIDYENKNSQTSWKMAEKTRRTLNMILFGKVGLRDGKNNLDLLVNSLKSLALISADEDISNEMRDNISKSWKYIFSSQKHDNYEELVEIFYDMKRKNLIPKLKIDERLLNKNIVSLTLTQKQKNYIINDCNYYCTNSINNLKQTQENNTNSFNDSAATSKVIPKLTLDTTEPMISKDSTNISLNITNNNGKNQSFSDFLSENVVQGNCKINWENQCLKLLTQIENYTKDSSIYWSKQSEKIINNCILFYKSNQLLTLQLQKVLQKAYKGLLSYDDHREILKIYNSKISENS